MRILFALFFSLSASLMFFGSIDYTFGAVEPINYESASKLAPCLLELCAKYFHSSRKSRGSLVVINLVRTRKSLLQRKILEAINEDKNHTLGVMVKDGKLPHLNASAWGVTDKAKSYMLLMLAFEDLIFSVKQWRMLPTWNPLAQTVIVLLKPIENIDNKDLLVGEVLNALLADGMINAIVVYQMENEDSKLVAETWFPYYNGSCGTVVENIYKIDECVLIKKIDSDTNMTKKKADVKPFNEELFPRIPNNFHDCTLNVSAFIWAPFVVSTKNIEQGLAGLEIQMLNSITNQMGLKINYNILDDSLLAAKITDDNKTGIYADLLQKQSDLMVGGLYENKISLRLVSSSIPYYQDDITWCLTKAGLAPTWLNVFIIFNKYTWIALIVTLFVTSFVFLYFVKLEGNYKENIVWSVLVTFSFITSQYGHYWPNKGGIKIFLAGMFFFGLHINTAYKSYLINVLTNPRFDEQIDTVEKAIGAGLVFEVGENTVDFFKEKTDAASQYLKFNHKICNEMDECFRTLLSDKTKVLAISRAHAANNPFGSIDNPIINEKIRIIGESGLLTKWQIDSKNTGTKKTSNENAASTDSHGSAQMKLRLEHVEGAFLLIVIGLSFALFIFVLELFINWHAKKKKNVRIMQKIHAFKYKS